MSQFTRTELSSILSACDIAYHKKDLELRRVRRNKHVIDERANTIQSESLRADLGIMTYEEQEREAKEGKTMYRHLRNKLRFLLEMQS